MKIAIFSDFDSRVKWGVSVCSNMLPLNHLNSCLIDLYVVSFDFNCLGYYDLPLNSVVNYQNKAELLDVKDMYDVIILALGGGDNLAFLNSLHPSKRPIIISGFNGLTDGSDVHGLLCRYGSDVICVNSRNDMLFYKSVLRKLNLSTDSLVLVGFQRSYLSIGKYIKGEVSTKTKREILLFVEQVGIPDTLARLEYLVLNLNKLALLNADKDIFIKIRKKKGFLDVNFKERTYDFKTIWNYKIKGKPRNVYFVDEEIEEVLPKVSLCFSFTSTVILEALALGIDVAVLSDFGINKNIGNHVFIGSDLFSSIDEISKGARPKVSDEWLKDNLTINLSLTLQKKISKLIEMEKKNIQIYYTEDKFPFYYFQKNNKTFRNSFKRYFFYKLERIKGKFRWGK